jgi:hypothetical protein
MTVHLLRFFNERRIINLRIFGHGCRCLGHRCNYLRLGLASRYTTRRRTVRFHRCRPYIKQCRLARRFVIEQILIIVLFTST